MKPDTSELADGAFSCLPGCGYCCTVSPGVRADEEPRIRGTPATRNLLVRRDDGSLGLKLQGHACGALGRDRACTVYADRPDACRLFPFHVHAGRRVQVSVNLSCPGVWADMRARVPAAPAAVPLEVAAEGVVARVLAAPGADRAVSKAAANYREMDRRLREVGDAFDEVGAARAFEPLAPALLDADSLARVYAGLASGKLRVTDVGELPDFAATTPAEDLVAEIAAEWWSEVATLPPAVDRELRWYGHHARGGAVSLVDYDGARPTPHGRPVAIADALLPWSDEARREGEAYLRLLTRRDHTGGAAARVVDATGYEVTFASAYGRVLADAAAGVVLRAGVAAAARGADEVGEDDAREAVRATDMAFLSQATLGAIL